MVSLDIALPVRVSLDQTTINGKAFTAHQAFLHASAEDGLEYAPKEITLAEASVPVLGKGRVIGNAAIQPQPTKPAIGEVEMNFFAEAALRTNAEAVANYQHADHQLRID